MQNLPLALHYRRMKEIDRIIEKVYGRAGGSPLGVLGG